MIRELTFKYHSYASTTSAVFLCFYLFSACGLGTEVGNGNKEKGESKKGTQANSESGSNDGQDESTNAGSDSDKEDSSIKAPLDYGVDMAIIFNSCGSPFEAFYKMPFVLSGTAKSGKTVNLEGDFNATLSTLEISDGDNNVLAHVKDDITADDHKVIVTKKDDTTYPSSYVCSEVVETDETGIFSYSVIMTPVDSEGMTNESKPESTLSWVVDKTQPTPELISISVTSEEDELLKLESDSE